MAREVVVRGLEVGAKMLLADLLPPNDPPDGWEFVSWDCEQGLSLSYERGEDTVYIEIEPYNEDMDCYLRTEKFNVNARPVRSANRDIGPGGRSLMAWVETGLRAHEDLLDQAERPRGTRRGSLREIKVEQVLIAEGRGQYYINPYMGCTIGCSFCYVAPRADLSRRIEGLPELPWGTYVDVKVDAPEILARELKENEPGLVRLSPILTDPYQPAERKYRITRKCLEVMLPAGYVPVILTRARLILDDLELLQKFENPMAGFSIPTNDDRIRQMFEPGADPVEQRIDALQKLHKAGIITLVVIQPMMPMDVDRMIAEVAPYTDVVRIDRMYFDFARHIYEEHGIEWANRETFFRETWERLVAGFKAHGAFVDDMDDMAALHDVAVERRKSRR